MEFENLKKQADILGLTGAEAAQYITEQKNIARDERQREREHDRLMRDQRNEMDKKKMEHEEEMARIEASRNAPQVLEAVPNVARPTLPEYKDGEDISTYIIRFERVAALLNIPQAQYAVRLGSKLTGKAAEIYTSLSPEITSNYALLRQALLQGFCKTPDRYRLDFRNARIQPGETFTQFMIGLGRKLDLWISSSDVTDSYSSLREFVLLDQFKSSVSPEMRVFLKENDCNKVEEAVKLADNYASAHNLYPKFNG